jgi:prepilin signal peptidase PulO-like enzyme (type II secretory pathway)
LRSRKGCLSILLANASADSDPAVIGLTLGHGIAVIFNRFFKDEPLRGPIYGCPACRSRFRFVDAIPLLLSVTGRKCSICGALLPFRFLVLPLGEAALFAISTIAFEDLGSGLLGGFFATVFLTLAMTDIDRRPLPNRIVYPAISDRRCWVLGLAR